MAVVTEYLTNLIAKQVEDRSLVVWYDPDRAYSEAAAALSLPKTTIARYDGSVFKLRHGIDGLMNGLRPPRLVVYVPLAQSEMKNALIELEAAGVVMQPGQQPPNRNTRLAIVARNALKAALGEENAAEIEKQVEAGQHSLADLNKLADMGKGLSTAGLVLVYGTGTPQEVARLFLAGDDCDAEIEKKGAQAELVGLVQTTFDCEVPNSISLGDLRDRLTRHVLMTDLAAALGGELPPSLASMSVAGSPVGVDQCVRLVRSWRNDRTVRDSYVAAATRIEQEVSLDKLALDPQRIAEVETFMALERMLLRHVEESLLDAATPNLLTLARSRLSRFWSDVTPALQARWALVATAAEVLLEADRVSKALKKAPTTLPALVKAYAEGDDPWCLLDTHHRNMESRKFAFEFASDGEHDSLEKLIVKAEQRYTEVGSALAKHFVTQFQKAKLPAKGLLRQREVFETQVKPKLDGERVAYVWVDALRFEMARELSRLLRDDYEVAVHPALGTPPTITEIGMAALLPKAHESAKVVGVGGGKLGLEIGGTIIKERKDRVAFLKQHAGVPVFEAKLDDLLPKPSKKVREGIENARLVLITSQEIDELCEKDNITQARLQMDGVLGHLRRAIRVLADHGVRSMVIAADHGHLFAEEIGEDMKIEAPGGDTADLHRRVWVGVGGTSEPSYLRAPLSSLGVESDLDLATPWTFACFKSKGGARAYFHGGLSPQELIVPVVTLTATAKAGITPSGVEWTLTPGSAKLSTRFFSVQVGGQQSGLFALEPPKVRVEVRANKKVVSTPISASYGFEPATGEVVLKVSEQDGKRIEPNTITVMIAEEINQKTVSVVLLDASTGVQLQKADDIEVAISM